LQRGAGGTLRHLRRLSRSGRLDFTLSKLRVASLFMRALSVKQPWAEQIACGKKKSEYRTWSVNFRGDLLVVASKGRNDEDVIDEGLNPGKLTYGAAMCVVDLYDVIEDEDGDYAWKLRNPRRVEPVPVTGYAAIYTVDDALIRPLEGKRSARSQERANAAPPKPKGKRGPVKVDWTQPSFLDPKVLVIDDDKARMRRVAKAVTARYDLVPECVSDMTKAWDIAEALRPQIMVMPTSAAEIARRVRETVWGKRSRILLLGRAGKADAVGDGLVASDASGADLFLALATLAIVGVSSNAPASNRKPKHKG
jgi:ASCH domain